MLIACCLAAGQVLSSVLSGLFNNYNMQMPNDFATLTAALAKLPHIKIAKAISVTALVYIAYVCAQLTWQLSADVTPISIGHSGVKATDKFNTKPGTNIDKLVALNLFGKVNVSANVTETVMVDVPETKLNLTLSGVVASSDQSKAAAIIERSGAQETYGIGDKISNTRATLEQVHADRVIIKQSGRMETLMLDGFDYYKAKQQPKPRPKQNVSSKTHQARRSLIIAKMSRF